MSFAHIDGARLNSDDQLHASSAHSDNLDLLSFFTADGDKLTEDGGDDDVDGFHAIPV